MKRSADAVGGRWGRAVLDFYEGPRGTLEVVVTPAPRVDCIIWELLDDGPVTLEGLERVARAVGIASAELRDAMRRTGVVKQLRGQTTWCELPVAASDPSKGTGTRPATRTETGSDTGSSTRRRSR